ncbi:MAG TPA: hypothetical protein VGL53_08265 [Bryobacteraceae bacterium]|jgi:hypothetical protein
MDDIRAEDLVGEGWAEWYRLTPAERFLESMKLWETYLALGGSLEPEPDTQSPFFDEEEWRENARQATELRSSVRRWPAGRE